MADRNLLIGLESYVPRRADQLLDLHQGFWDPDFQQCGERISDGGKYYLPATSPGAGAGLSAQVLDNMRNDHPVPIIVRTVSFTWKPEYASDVASFTFDLQFKRRGQTRHYSVQKAATPPANAKVGRSGTQAVVGPYVWRPAAPIRIPRDGIIYLKVGAAVSEAVYTFATVAAGAATDVEHVIFCRGVSSGRGYRFADTVQGQAGNLTVDNYQNAYGEELDIVAIAVLCPNSVNYRAVFELAVNGKRCMEAERLFWLFAEPFPYARLDLSGLPEGGLVLYPQDTVGVTFSGV